MAASSYSLPDLDRRLVQDRSAVFATAEALRVRVRQEIKELSPKQQIKQHPEAALATVGVTALIAGRIAGGILRFFLR